MNDKEATEVLRLINETIELRREIERLRTELANVNNEFGSQTADWPDAWKRVAELKQLSNDRWRENERLQALNSSLTDKANAYLIENARLAEQVGTNAGCYPGCYYYTDSCFRDDCKKTKEKP